MAITTSASIVIYRNNPATLLKTINSFLDNSNGNTRLYIIDNSPTDELSNICNSLPEVVYIFNGENIGFGAAHNIAIKAAIELGAEYHLVLNPDIEFEKGTIKSLVRFMEEHQGVGLVMPKVTYPNGSIQYLCKLLPTPADLILRRFLFFLPWAKKREKKYELHSLDYEQTHFDIPSLSGCFMFLRTSVLRKTGGFDDRYFMYMEDVDLCRRIHKASQTVYYADVSVVHHYDKGSYKSFKLLRYHITSALKYFGKWGWFIDRERSEINKKYLNK